MLKSNKGGEEQHKSSLIMALKQKNWWGASHAQEYQRQDYLQAKGRVRAHKCLLKGGRD